MSPFANAGQKPGLEIWRIEKMEPVVWTDHGKFCEGDSYIVLSTTQKPGHSSFSWNIHFWLGSETSQDEAGVAAYKTVELDDHLGGAPVQHRETQGNESDLFLSYFKKGVEYISGGVESGFTKVVRDVYPTRLLQCKGKRLVRVRSVPVAASSMNSGDVFILDCGLTIYQWNGSEANRKEKAKALDVTGGIKNDERGGRAKVYVVDEGSETPDFWEAIGGKGQVQSAAAGGSDEASESANKDTAQLLRVSDASGSLQVDTVATGSLRKDMLDTNDVFIVDGGNDVFVWIGKGANAEERKQGMKRAQDYCNQAAKPTSVRITKVAEGGEVSLFKQQFSDWTEMKLPSFGQAKPPPREKKEIDFNALAEANNPAETLVDDGSGQLECYRIENFDKELVDKRLVGRFFAGDSYICKYSYKKGSKQEHIIYFWLGRDSSQDEKATAAMLTIEMDNELGGAATQVRVVQGKEPLHFLSLFKGNMIICSGGKASAFKNKVDTDSYDTDGVHLFHIKGTTPLNTRAVQVEELAKSLNSGDCFLLQNPDNIMIWFGSGASDAEKECARKLGDILKKETSSKSAEEIAEGEEPESFWTFLGGKADYATSKEMEECPAEPRLFQVSNATGDVQAEEIYNFAQEDLDQSDVFLLDVGTELYSWIGSEANRTETEAAKEVAAKYLEQLGRSADTPIIQIHAGSEPVMFTSAFLGWDSNRSSVFEDPYEKKLRLIAESKAKDAGEPVPASKPAAAAAAATAVVPPGSQTFPLAELQNKTAPGVDPTKREQYLSDADFQAVFKMDKAAFAKLKGWRQTELKKQHKLF